MFGHGLCENWRFVLYIVLYYCIAMYCRVLVLVVLHEACFLVSFFIFCIHFHFYI